MFGLGKQTMVDPDKALPGRIQPVMPPGIKHDIFGIDLRDEPAGCAVAYLALGCFWGAEKLYWSTPGVVNTAAGYLGGFTPHPTYEEVCSGKTGHAETVKVVFDPAKVSYAELLKTFFEDHDPTQGMRQGNDVGTQYRSAIFTTGDEQAVIAARVRDEFQKAFSDQGYGQITTEIEPALDFYYAEAYHQQYLDKNPGGYCPAHGTGIACPIPR